MLIKIFSISKLNVNIVCQCVSNQILILFLLYLQFTKECKLDTNREKTTNAKSNSVPYGRGEGPIRSGTCRIYSCYLKSFFVIALSTNLVGMNIVCR